MLFSATIDRKPDTAAQRRNWQKVRRAEVQSSRALRGVARTVGHIVQGLYDATDPNSDARVREALHKYAEMLRPWARIQAARMVADVSRRDEAVWRSIGKEMSRDLMKELEGAPTGAMLAERMEEAAILITSLPLKAAARVHELTQKALTTGARADEISAEIMRTGEVTKSRADLIARTEAARTASGLVEARATFVGSDGYIWRTAGDSDVRKDHKALNGKFIKWSEPPIADKRSGARAHAGQIYNCRCYPEPVIPEEEDMEIAA